MTIICEKIKHVVRTGIFIVLAPGYYLSLSPHNGMIDLHSLGKVIAKKDCRIPWDKNYQVKIETKVNNIKVYVDIIDPF